jgi:hypothetical protein
MDEYGYLTGSATLKLHAATSADGPIYFDPPSFLVGATALAIITFTSPS